jgi:hypothetical protein
MSGKNPRFRTVVAGFVVLLVLAGGAQGAVLQRASPVTVDLLDRILPASLRAWLAPVESAGRAPGRAMPVKCGITIDPNGGPCPHPAGTAPWTHRRVLPLKCGGTIEPNGSPCPHAACTGCG